jgi:hypothetical protein
MTHLDRLMNLTDRRIDYAMKVTYVHQAKADARIKSDKQLKV